MGLPSFTNTKSGMFYLNKTNFKRKILKQTFSSSGNFSQALDTFKLGNSSIAN